MSLARLHRPAVGAVVRRVTGVQQGDEGVEEGEEGVEEGEEGVEEGEEGVVDTGR